MEGSRPEKVLILGGGAAGLAAAWRLSEPGWRDRFESITVLERGWRLGGKGASSRGLNGRIEEHGLHVWLGYYDNAFRLVRQVYEELDRPLTRPEAPIRTWRDAFSPANEIGLEDFHGGRWRHWVANFSPNDLLPGESDEEATEPLSVAEFVRRSLQLLSDFYTSLEESAGGRIILSASPHPPPRQAPVLGGLSGRLLLASALAAATQVMSVLHSQRDLLPPLASLERLRAAVESLHQWLRKLTLSSDEARRLWSLCDLIVTTVRGILVDGLLTDPRGFAALNDEEYRDWISRHGAATDTLDSALVRGVYDLVFGFEDGDPTRPGFAAGLGLFLSGKLFFEYRGSIFWKLNAGMGDVVFAPLYEALTSRGVTFRFFSRVEDLRPSAGGREIGEVVIAQHPQTDDYQPLVEVGGLPCFPAIPNLATEPGWSPDSIWSGSEQDQIEVLQAGRDFHHLVFALPIGMVPYVARRLVDSNPDWKGMTQRVGTVATQVFQLWVKAGGEELGWRRSRVTMTGFEKPFETWSSMDHLLAMEQWPEPDRPRSLAYFCNTLPTSGLPDPDDFEYPKRQHERVRENAVNFLSRAAGHFWPGAVEASGGFRWDLLVDSADRAGEDRFDSQYWRANVDPSERYVLSLPGSDKYRLRADQSGYHNMALAGDWINCGLNAGCMEAAVMSGLQAANVVLGRPLTHRISGYYLDLGK
ncbi:MAG TPA: FAD-dependent oxidoreductase [Acidimicrobiia bacterium]|nr:FAD-dependent oxidoreductase [Acidimicrobiia bacterium]